MIIIFLLINDFINKISTLPEMIISSLLLSKEYKYLIILNNIIIS